MVKLNITESLVRNAMAVVESDVKRLTDWNLELDSLGVRVLPKDRGYEDIVLARLRGVRHRLSKYMKHFIFISSPT